MRFTVRDLSCGYDPERPVLDRVTFELKDHEICVVLGANGVGKTTLFKTLLRFIPPLKGTVQMDGSDVLKWSAMHQARNVAYVAQMHTPPFPYLAGDVVMLGRVSSTGYFRQPSETDRKIVRQAMEDMGIWSLREKSYTDISGGERQLVMLARALAQEPHILVLDEPTSGLDYGNQVRVLEKICELRDEGYGIIMTSTIRITLFSVIPPFCCFTGTLPQSSVMWIVS
jgi:iron complex transport system ATP-binding protein